ncbi:RHS repeat-associated core domain-containing protein [Rhodanobacter lindaniclasticus]
MKGKATSIDIAHLAGAWPPMTPWAIRAARVSCAVTPDGTRYWFTHLVYRWAATMERPMGTGPLAWRAIGVQPQIALEDRLIRRQASMLVSRIEDRFGNSLTYSYNGAQLTAITASDGRQVTLSYVSGTDRIGTISVAPASGPTRTWSYQYSTALTPLLSQVTLPDGSAWSYDLAGLRNGETLLGEGDCDNLGALSTNVPSGSMVHPSGLTGTFQITPVVRGRSYVPRQCRKNADDSSYAHIPRAYATLAITRKTFSGAGLPTRSWNYGYSPANASWLQDCTGGCTSTVWTDVVDPDGHATRHTFSNRFDETEGQLQRVDRYSAAIGTPVLRAEVDQYAASDAGPWPSVYGDNLQSRMNAAVVGRQVPLNQRVIGQDGDSYTWQAEAFNAFAQVTQTKQYNSIAGQGLAQEQTAYRNDTALWVLGLPLTVTHLATGEVESANTYDTSNDTLLTRARFGQTLMSYTFNSAGQLASFTDGNNHTTTLGNYKRGIPQAIGYPDGTSQAVAVDDFGQIGAITDQAGHTTHYSYDPAGRITGISYPTGDEVAWLPTTFTYDFVTSAERGMAANHWRRTTTTGNATAVTTFDAMLRPVLSDSAIGSVVQASTLSTYNANGQQVFSAYPSAMALTFALSPTVDGSTTSYDALGHVTQVAQDSELGVLTRRTAYLSGARQQVTDAKGNLTTTSYQVFDQPSYEAVTQVQAPTGITQTIARDGYGNPLSITQSGLYGTETNTVIKTLIYDSAHRLCRTTEPESGSTVMDYDGANDLAWSAAGLAITGSGCGREQVAAAARTTRSYDAMNRVLVVDYPSGDDASFAYDPRGNLSTSVSGLATWTYARNARGLLTRETLGIEGYVWPLNYGYDSYGKLATVTSISVPATSQRRHHYQLGKQCHGNQLRPRREGGRWSMGAGLLGSFHRHHDDGDRVGQLRLSGAGLQRQRLQRLRVEYCGDGDAPAGQRAELERAGQQHQRQLYGELGHGDDSDQLHAAGAGQRRRLGHDPGRQHDQQGAQWQGQRHLRLSGAGLQRRRLRAVEWHPGHHGDAAPGGAGRSQPQHYRPIVQTRGACQLDGGDRRHQLPVGGDPSAGWRSHRLQRRVHVVEPADLCRRAGAVPGQGVQQRGLLGVQCLPKHHVALRVGPAAGQTGGDPGEGSGIEGAGADAMSRHARGWITLALCLLVGASPMAQAAAPVVAVRLVMTDVQGTPVMKKDLQGHILVRYDYRPYGAQQGGPVQAGPGYTGHVNDPQTGLVYMQQRYYDPDARFLSVDPIGPTPGNVFNFSRYTYANDNPIANIDPTGMASGDRDDICMGNMQCVSNTPRDEQRMKRISQQTKPSNVPFGGSESVAVIAGRVNGETSGMRNSLTESESLQSAQIKIATVRLNGILKWGKAVQAHASLAPPMMSGPGYKSALRAVQTAIAEKMNGIDDTFGVDHSKGGALLYNMRTPSQAADDRPFWGFNSHTVSGPYISPTIYTYIVTYGQ